MAMKDKIGEIMAGVRSEGRKALTDYEAKMLVSFYDLPVSRTIKANSKAEATNAAEAIGFPVVMKVLSREILHKTEVSGVKLNLKNMMDVGKAYDEIMEATKNYSVDGVTVAQFVPFGKEVIVGSMKDKTFGQCVMFGLGGIWVEVIKDVSFGLAPLNKEEAVEMISGIKGYPLLKGVRGEPESDIDSIAEILVKTSNLIAEYPEIAEMDLNPVFVYQKGAGCKVVDARIILE